MKTTRVSKNPFSPVTLVNTASDTRWATRRTLLASVAYCWPVTCAPVETSHRRNAVCTRPSPPRLERPVTTYCAFTARNASIAGGWSGLPASAAEKLARSIGVMKTERLKLLVMIEVTCAAAFAGELRDGDRDRLERAAGANVERALLREGREQTVSRGSERSRARRAGRPAGGGKAMEVIEGQS